MSKTLDENDINELNEMIKFMKLTGEILICKGCGMVKSKKKFKICEMFCFECKNAKHKLFVDYVSQFY